MIDGLKTAIQRVQEIEHKIDALNRPAASRVKNPQFEKILSKETAALSPQKGEKFSAIINDVSHKYGIHESLIRAVIKTESGNQVFARSPKGALGLMQLMPETARQLRVKNPYDPRQNIEGGAAYLKQLLGMFNDNLPMSLAAYNAGPARVKAAGKIPNIKETQDYVRKVMRYYRQFNGAEAVNG